MTKLIGTNPNQVPSNADLGTAAFMNKEDFILSSGGKISSINSVVEKTAVDVCVYDTTMDSDGGAWRKKTEGLSWYKEPLNTEIRGSRREFPSVAVIVVETTRVTIYDGDDTNLPMWMVFDRKDAGSDVTFIGANAGELKAVDALNGVIAVGMSIYGCFVTDLLSDRCIRHRPTSSYILSENVAGRCKPSALLAFYEPILSADVNDVSLAVLPTSQIGKISNLPIPAIAIATNSGINVVAPTEEKTVISSSTYDGSIVHWTPENYLAVNAYVNFSPADRAYILEYPSLEGVRGYYESTAPAITNTQLVNCGFHNDMVSSKGTLYGANYVDGTNAHTPLVMIDYDPKKDQNTDMASYISNNYNTGWFPADLKMATLCNTDRGDIDSREHVLNGTFNTNLNDWTSVYNVTASVVSGEAKLVQNQTVSWSGIKQTFTVIPYADYVLTFTLASVSGTDYNLVSLSTGTSFDWTIWKDYVSSSLVGKPQSVRFNAGNNTQITLNLAARNDSTTGNFNTWDNISIKKAEMDYSLYGYEAGNDNFSNPLIPYGYTKKTPVAEGSDIMAYGPFDSNTAYFVRPYNASTNIGTGDFCISYWIYDNDRSQDVRHFFLNHDLTSTSEVTEGFCIGLWNSQFRFLGAGGATTTGVIHRNSQWEHILCKRQDGHLYLYINGVLRYNTTYNHNLSATEKGCMIGNRGYSSQIFGPHAYLSMMKFSGSAPSHEQIQRMYREEKDLYTPNAKATLYGSATFEEVHGLSYDKRRNLLHVGTSAGRSVFQGLRRVDHTTDPVTVAISAGNNLVAEE